MRSLLTLLVVATVIGCTQNKSQQKNKKNDYLAHKEYEFAFVVFDKLKVDTFFTKYTPVRITNKTLRKSIDAIAQQPIINAYPNVAFAKNTRQPTDDDYTLAANVLKAINGKDGDKYFSGAVGYLLFYECLPAEFHQKWVQVQLGDFKIDETFFKLLRKNCKLFDDLIYGNTGYWDKNLILVFEHEVFNEITPANAKTIKACITGNNIFNDVSFIRDKAMLISFLDNIILGKWRMLLLDWN